MKFNQAGFSDTIFMAIVGGIIGSLFITGVFVWTEIDINNVIKKANKKIIDLGKEEKIEYIGNNSICENINSVKSIVIENNYLNIEFIPNSGFNLIGKELASGVKEPFEYGTEFKVEYGDTIYWGDGDHATQYLKLKNIKDTEASLEYREEFYWNGKTTEKVQNCIIKNKYQTDIFLNTEKLKAVDCLLEQRNVDACVDIYEPVCGQLEVECMKAPCNLIKQTFGNSCKACSNERVLSYYEGECTDNNEINYKADNTCDRYFDANDDCVCRDGYVKTGVPWLTEFPREYCKIDMEWEEFTPCSSESDCEEGFYCVTEGAEPVDYRCAPIEGYASACGCDLAGNCYCS